MARVALILLVLLPLSLSAQTIEELQARIAALMAQIQAAQTQSAPPPVSGLSACPALSRTLALGARGEDVRSLQEFLRSRGLLQSEATGYFGSLTEAALRAFQAAEGVVSSGNAASTGFGVMGVKTRAAIAARCGGAQTVTPGAATCPVAPGAPVIPCAGVWQKLQSGACHTGWRCVLSNTGNKPPVIDAIEGPSTLLVGESASWRIVAQDPEGSALSYAVTWGDESVEEILRSLAGIGTSFTQSSLLSHAYAKAGNYTLRVDVKDTLGAISSATHAISVRSQASGSSSPAFSFVPPIATTAVQKSCVTPWGAQVIAHGQASFWQPFFTEGAYFPATSSPIVKCENGEWLKCSSIGADCQKYTVATSTPQGALQGYANVIGTPCSGKGSTKTVTVPPGTQLCQWLSCSVTTEARAVTLTCTDGGWSDYKAY